MKAIGIIPARLAATRFPNKPMAQICGMPMVGHCYHRTRLSQGIEATYVATCDPEIANYVESIGGFAIATADTHNRATTRTAEAIEHIEKSIGEKIDIVVMVQGDEPMVLPEMIEMAIQPLLHDPTTKVSNIMTECRSEEEWQDSNEVKVVVDNESNALYFSREPIPSKKKYSGNFPIYKQVCIIPFTRDCLLDYTELEPTTLEMIESVDMNRFIEHGFKVKMVLTEQSTFAVDTPQDLKIVERLMKEDTLRIRYS